MSKIIDLCKKLNALAKQGVGGEKDNALAMLKSLMQKHGISIEDIEDGIKKERSFKPNNRKLFVQIVSTVIGKDFKAFKGFYDKRKIIVELSDSEYLEIEAKYNFYQREYNKELKKFLCAFIMKNKLYPPEDENEEERKPLTSKEKAELWYIANMAQGIEKSDYLKQLNY